MNRPSWASRSLSSWSRVEPAGAQKPSAVRAVATDSARLRAVSRYDLGNPILRGRLDAITAQTTARLGLPISLVSVVLDSAQLLVGSTGLDGWLLASGGTPLEWSFCAHAVASGRPYVVEDTILDDTQRTNPLVTIDGIRSYAGVPLVTREGLHLGAHCAIGVQARRFTRGDLAALQHAAGEVIAVLETFATPLRGRERHHRVVPRESLPAPHHLHH